VSLSIVGRKPKSPAKDSIDTLSVLLDAIPAPKEDTDEFENIKQEDICDAIKYWIDQTKTFFGEPVQVMIFHNPREEGIDMSIDLLKSKVKFGIQVKTYGDIQKTKSFADKIHSQINRSSKHNLPKCVLAFAGDLSNQSQNLKVTGAIAEIHQTNDDYVFIIPPMNLMTIFKVYKNKDNPSQFINLNSIERAIILARGITKALSNDKREAKVTINLHYPQTVGDDKGFKVSLRVKGGEYSLWDRIENVNPGEEVVIPKDQIEEFNVTDNEGNPVLAEKIDSDLIIQPEKKYLSMNLQTVSLKGKIFDSIDNYKFEVKKQNDIVRWEAADESEPCRFFLQYDETVNMANINFTLEIFRGDAQKLVKRLDFLKTIKSNSKLKMVHPETKRGQIIGLPNKLPIIPDST